MIAFALIPIALIVGLIAYGHYRNARERQRQRERWDAYRLPIDEMRAGRWRDRPIR
jgi:hypothetical protein